MPCSHLYLYLVAQLVQIDILHFKVLSSGTLNLLVNSQCYLPWLNGENSYHCLTYCTRMNLGIFFSTWHNILHFCMTGSVK